MKIVHISHLYHPSEGGVQFFFKNISERLVKDHGDDVTVVTCNSIYGPERKIYKKVEPAEEVINGVKVIRFDYRRWHIQVYPIIFKVLAKLSINLPEWMILQASGPYSPAMNKYLMEVQADAFCGSASNYYFMQLPLWRKCNFFYYGSIHLNEDETKHSLYPTQLKAVKASTLYLANTTYEKHRLEKLGVDSKKVYVLGTGVDVESFNVSSENVASFRNNAGIPADGILIGYVGRIEKTKNVSQVIESFRQLAEGNDKLYLLIAGSANTYQIELAAYCKTFPKHIADRVKWKANFSIEEKPLIFNSIDIFVLPSYNESFGIVFLEAWSCKKPVIGVAIGAIRNVIDEGRDGLLMEKNSVSSLSAQLTRLIHDPSLRQQLGENGYKKVTNNFTWDIIVSRLRQCYFDALSA